MPVIFRTAHLLAFSGLSMIIIAQEAERNQSGGDGGGGGY